MVHKCLPSQVGAQIFNIFQNLINISLMSKAFKTRLRNILIAENVCIVHTHLWHTTGGKCNSPTDCDRARVEQREIMLCECRMFERDFVGRMKG